MTHPHLFAAAVLAITLLMTGAANAAIAPGDDVVVGVATDDDSCDRWVAARAANRDATRRVDEYLTVTWMQGYLSGANMTHAYADPKTAVALPSAVRISAWLDKACKDEPRTPMFFLADKLMKELQKRP
jgi:hypothetical protein